MCVCSESHEIWDWTSICVSNANLVILNPQWAKWTFDCFLDWLLASFIGPLRCFSSLDLLLNSDGDAVTQSRSNKIMISLMKWPLLILTKEKAKGKSIYISGPGKILSKNVYWLDWFCRRKISKENSISKSTENEVFSTLKEKIT